MTLRAGSTPTSPATALPIPRGMGRAPQCLHTFHLAGIWSSRGQPTLVLCKTRQWWAQGTAIPSPKPVPCREPIPDILLEVGRDCECRGTQ